MLKACKVRNNLYPSIYLIKKCTEICIIQTYHLKQLHIYENDIFTPLFVYYAHTRILIKIYKTKVLLCIYLYSYMEPKQYSHAECDFYQLL